MEKQQQELQFLGFFGIFKESLRIIFSKPKLFSQITLTLILPVSIIDQTYHYFSHSISSKHFAYSILFEIIYYFVILIPSILSTSAIVCVITFLYTGKDVAFRKIRGMLPKIWKRVMITFALSFAMGVSYGKLFGTAGAWMIRPLFPEQVNPREIVTTKSIIGTIIVFLYMASYVYIRIIGNLATVVSVIEDLSGIKAMIKSTKLIKAKIGVAVLLWLVFTYCFAEIDGRLYGIFLGADRSLNWRNGVGVGIPCFIFLASMVSLVGLVVNTVIYFSCKSHEVTMRVLTTQSHQTNFKSIWWSVLDPLME